jgi:hypothetical protein
MSESKPRARYTLEFKLESFRLVKGGQVAAVKFTFDTGLACVRVSAGKHQLILFKF